MKGYVDRGKSKNGHKTVRKDVNPGSKLDLQRVLVFALAHLAKHMGQGTADALVGLSGHPTLRANLDATKSLVTRLASVMSGNGNMQECLYPFTIGDSYDHTAKHTFGRVKYGGVGVELTVDGYGEHNAQNGLGSPVYLEIRNGIPHVIVWGDINSEDPTHVISLEGAAESLRIPDLEGDSHGEEQEPQEETGEEAGIQAAHDSVEDRE